MAVLLLLGGGARAQVITVPNASFETPALGSTYQYQPTGASWDFSAGAAIAGNGSGFTASNPNAPLGSQVAVLQGTGTVGQSLSGFVVGATYRVTFSAAQRAGMGQTGQTWQVKVGSTAIASFAPSALSTSYLDYSVQFTAAATTNVITFAGTNLNGGDHTVLIDNVRIEGTSGLKADYYGTNDLTGPVVLSRTDSTVNFSWGSGSPAAGIAVDNFSTRWSGQVQPQYSQTYTFYTNTDDGVRLWVNGIKLVDHFTGQSPTEYSGTIALIANQKYDIVMEYYEGGGGAVAQLSWSSASRSKQIIPQSRLFPAASGLKGEYYSNMSLSGTPALTRTDAGVNFAWGNGSPDPALPTDQFSAIWTGQATAQYTQTYTFYTNSNDGVRLWVNGVQLIDNWTDHGDVEDSGTIALVAGQKYDIDLEFYESINAATMQLSWSSSSTPKAIIPASVLSPISSGASPTAPVVPGNFGFETPVLAGGTFQYAPTGAGWTFSSSAALSSNGSAFTGGNSAAPQGAQVAVLQGTGFVSQSVSGFYQNVIYTLTFSAAQRNYGQTGAAWRATVGGVVVGTYAPPQSATAYTDYTAQFVTTGGAFVVAFEGLNNGDNTVFIDNIRIVPSTGGVPAPTAPTGLSATAVSVSQINLGWTDNSNSETGFKIEQKPSGGSFSQIGIASANATAFSVTGLAQGTQYTFRVRATNGGGDSAYSNESSATTQSPPPSLPAAPMNLTANGNYPYEVHLGWTDNSNDELNFNLERKLGSTGTYAVVFQAPANWNSCSDVNVEAGTQYYYRIAASNAAGLSTYSNEVAFLTVGVKPPSPSAPTGLSAVSYFPNTVHLGWIDNAANDTGYKLERKTGANGSWALVQQTPANWTSCQDDTVLGGTLYYYRIRATSPSGDSLYSSEFAITTPAGGNFPPATPSSLTAVSLSGTQLQLTWVDNSTNEMGFKLDRKVGAEGAFAQIATLGVNTTSYQDNGLTTNQTYFYRLRATGAALDSVYSNEAASSPWNGPVGGVDFQGHAFVTQAAPVLQFQRRTSPNLNGIDYDFPEQTAKGAAVLSRFPSFNISDKRIHTMGPWYNNDLANLHFARGMTTIVGLPGFRASDSVPTTVRKIAPHRKWELSTDPLFWGHATQYANLLEAANPSDPRIASLRTFGINHSFSDDRSAYIELGRYVWAQESWPLDINGNYVLYPSCDIEVTWNGNLRNSIGWIYEGMVQAASDKGLKCIPNLYGGYTWQANLFADSYRQNGTGEPNYLLPDRDPLAYSDPLLKACQDNAGIVPMDGYTQAIWTRAPLYKRNGDGSLQLSGGLPVYNDITQGTAYGTTLTLESGESKAYLDNVYRRFTSLYMHLYRMAGQYPADNSIRKSFLSNCRIGAWSRVTNEGLLGIAQNDRPLPDWQMEMESAMNIFTADDIIYWSSDFNHTAGPMGADYSSTWQYNTEGVMENIVKAAHRYSVLDPIHSSDFKWCWFDLGVVNQNETAGDRYFEKPIMMGKLRVFEGHPWLELFIAWPALDGTPKSFKVWMDNGSQKSSAYTVQLQNGRSYFYDAWQLPDTFLNSNGQDVWIRCNDMLNVQRTWRGDYRVSASNSVATPADYTGP